MKKVFLAVLLSCIATFSYGQAPAWSWAKSPVSTNDDYSTSIARDGAGNTYVAGRFTSATLTFGGTTLTNAGQGDVFVVKYDASGNVVWARSAGSTQDEAAMSIAVDANGACYIAGYAYGSSLSFGSVVLANSLIVNMFVVKYDASGTALWARNASEVSGTFSVIQCQGRGIAVDASGACYVTGWALNNYPIVFGSVTLAGTGNGTDIVVVKYDTNGNVVWAKRPAGSTNDEGQSIATDGAGNCYVTGSFSSGTLDFGSGASLANAAAAVRMFTVKYNNAGTALWAATSSTPGGEESYAIAADNSGACYVAGDFGGSTLGAGTTTLSNAGTSNAFLVKYTATGGVAWAKSTGGNSTVYLLGLAVDTVRRIYLAGSFNGTATFGGASLATAGGRDAFVLKMDDTGAVVWAKGVGGADNDAATALAVDAAGASYVTGRFLSPTVAFGATTLSNNSNVASVFTAKLGACAAAPPQPGPVSGPAAPCTGTGSTFSVPAVAGATSYVWTLPSGWTGTSTTNSLVATPGPSGGTVTVAAVNACGSSPVRALTVASVLPAPAPVITQAGTALSTTPFASYQWYRNGSAVAGATGQTYIVTQSGSYYVVVKNATNCSGQSNALSITLGIQDPSRTAGLVTYPNPVRDALHLHLPAGAAAVTLSDATGRTLQTVDVVPGTVALRMDMAGWPAGIYLLTYKGSNGQETVKVIKE